MSTCYVLRVPFSDVDQFRKEDDALEVQRHLIHYVHGHHIQRRNDCVGGLTYVG